ncbi:hypothetical protein CLV62_12162 [Dysgonomonas alginatilytica]|uniref:Uncharacterized protein n=1 Tax=Dysgonomonas alginatilytica TaxID=1605892 RepID=A0A2V3PT20_9BACT|nr:hypothetical protein CLV62_12162 [Dysgonomonas alginatilytica]
MNILYTIITMNFATLFFRNLSTVMNTLLTSFTFN